jgi:phosphate:Na+ symporter
VFWLIKDTEEDLEDQADFDLLEERFLAYPPLAIEQSHMAMNGMAKKARKNIFRAMNLLEDFSEEKYQKVQEKENMIDKYEDRLGTFLMQLTGRQLTGAQTKEISKFLHTVTDFERLGDHAVNIAEVASEIHSKKITFSEEAEYELNVLKSAVCEIVDITVTAFCEDDLDKAAEVEPLREWIGILCDELKLRHVTRLSSGKCKIEQGFSFNDLLTNLERIAAHCSNVAVAMIELEASGFDTHQYLKSVRELHGGEYTAMLEAYEQKYDINGYKKLKKKDKEKDKEKEKEKDRGKDKGKNKNKPKDKEDDLLFAPIEE